MNRSGSGGGRSPITARPRSPGRSPAARSCRRPTSRIWREFLMSGPNNDLREAARECFTCSNPRRKCELTAQTFAALGEGRLAAPDADAPAIAIETPGRPDLPKLVPPRDVPQRGLGSVEGRAALVH